MTTTATSEAEANITRTYELFDIVWGDGARWTGYDTFVEAATVVLGARRFGSVVRRTWQVTFPAGSAHLYRAGVDPDG